MCTITPAEMADLLARRRNAMNRPTKPGNVDMLLRVVEGGMFEPYNGESMKFGLQETMLDFHHRGEAIARGTKTVTFLVILGCKNIGIGEGLARDRLDQLRMTSTEKPPHPRILRAVEYLPRVGNPTPRGLKLSSFDIHELLAQWREEFAFLQKTAVLRLGGCLLPPEIFTGLAYARANSSYEKVVDSFYDAMRSPPGRSTLISTNAQALRRLDFTAPVFRGVSGKRNIVAVSLVALHRAITHAVEVSSLPLVPAASAIEFFRNARSADGRTV